MNKSDFALSNYITLPQSCSSKCLKGHRENLLGFSLLLLRKLFYFYHHFIVKCTNVCIAIIIVFLYLIFIQHPVATSL